MELLQNKNELHYEGTKNTEELAICDLVGELLAISLEKHDVEIIVESKDFLIDRANSLGTSGMLKTTIDYDDIVESEDKLEVTISGIVENAFQQQETFALFFSLNWDGSVNSSWKRGYGKGLAANSLWLQFGKKAEQLSDSVFSVQLYRKEKDGYQYDLGHGRGFMLFGRETSSRVN